MSTRELQILNILFSSNEPMMVTDIMSQQSLSQSTVSLIVRKMLKDGYIEIAGYGRAGKVLSRMYRPTLKVKEAVKEYFGSLYKACESIVNLDELFQYINNMSNYVEECYEILILLDMNGLVFFSLYFCHFIV